MSVQVTGNITGNLTHTEPASPFAGVDIAAGSTATVTVGPYTNTSDVSQTVTGITVDQENNCTVTAAFQDGSTSVTVDPSSTVSIDCEVSVPADATGEYSFTVEDLSWTVS